MRLRPAPELRAAARPAGHFQAVPFHRRIKVLEQLLA